MNTIVEHFRQLKQEIFLLTDVLFLIIQHLQSNDYPILTNFCDFRDFKKIEKI